MTKKTKTTVPSSSEIAAAISFALGKYGHGPDIYKNYPINFNRMMPKVGASVRRWFVARTK